MNLTSHRSILRAILLGYLSLGASCLSADSFVTVDVPGAAATFITGINDNGDVTGGFYNSPNVYQGFLRTANGTITTFNLVPPSTGATETNPTAINNSDVITGNILGTQGCTGGTQCNQGFVRAADGTFTVFNVLADTFPFAINTLDETAGTYYDANYDVAGGFIRTSSGTITTLSAATLGISGINDNGDTTGQMVQGTRAQLVGFLRTASGTVTTFAAGAGSITAPAGINDSQQIAGSSEIIVCQTRLCDITESVGFLWQPSGSIATFNVPGNHQTFALGLNATAQIFGYYLQGTGTQRGFFRDSNGIITTFDVPNALQTIPAGMNSSGVIAGRFFDSAGVLHGFIRTP